MLPYTQPELIYKGLYFSVYKIEYQNRHYALKVPASEPEIPLYVAQASCYFSRLWSFQSHTGHVCMLHPPHRPTAEQLLRHECQRIQHTSGAWNTQCTFMTEISINGITTVGLLSPFWSGGTWADCPPQEQRRLFPMFLPALWRALCAHVHGDLQPSNILLDTERRSLALIDPGSLLTHVSEYNGGDYTANIFFTSNTQHYPIIPPYFRPEKGKEQEHTSPSSLIQQFIQQLHAQTTDEINHTLAHNQQLDTPHPADIIALGIMYYRSLCGAHPWYTTDFTAPVWLDGQLSSDPSQPDNASFRSRAAMLKIPVVPASSINPSVSPAEALLAETLLYNRAKTLRDIMLLIHDIA